MIKKYCRKMKRKKALLNFLLRYLSTNNRLIIYLSQDLDKLITVNQKHIFNKYIRKNLRSNPLRKVA